MKNSLKRITAWILTALMLFAVLPAGMFAFAQDTDTVYVSASGNDANSGTSSSPFKTIEKAIAALEAGDVTKTGYIVFQSNYTHDLVDLQNATVNFDTPHTRHIVFTSPEGSRKTITVKVGSAVYGAANYSVRFYGTQVTVRYNGPMTFDNIKVHFDTDDTIGLKFGADLVDQTVTLKDGGSALISFAAGDPLYATYEFKADPENPGRAVISKHGDQLPTLILRINHHVFGQYFEATESAPFTYDTAPDDYADERAAHPVITLSSSNYNYSFGQVYFSPMGEKTVLRSDSNWGVISPMGVVQYEDAEVILGGNVSKVDVRGIYSANAGPGTFRYVFEPREEAPENELHDIFGSLFAAKDYPTSARQVEYVFMTPLLNITGSPISSAVAANGGRYAATFDGYYMPSYLIDGYSAIRFQNFGGAVAFDPDNDLSAAVYDQLESLSIVDDGTCLDLTSCSFPLLRPLYLSLEMVGKEWSSDRVPVASVNDESALESVLLSDQTAAHGSLIFDEDDYMIYFVPDQSAVVFNGGGADIELPESLEGLNPGADFELPAPSVTELANGKVFAGWQSSADGNTYAAGDVASLVKGTVTFTALWGYKIDYVVPTLDEMPVDTLIYGVGEKAVLSNALTSYTFTLPADGDSVECSFYAWRVNGEIKFPGDEVVMTETGVTAEAVLAVAQFVDPTFEGESDGSKAAPHTSFFDAVIALKSLVAADDSIEAASIVFVGDQTVNLGEYAAVEGINPSDKVNKTWTDSKGIIEFMSNTRYSMYSAAVKPIGVPLLLTADSADTTVTFDNTVEGVYFFYFKLGDHTLIENMKLVIATETNGRIYFKNGGGIGLSGSASAGSNDIIIDMDECADGSDIRLYGGKITSVYLGTRHGKYSQYLHLAHNVSVNLLVLNNLSTIGDTYVYIRENATVNHLRYSYAGTTMTNSGLMDVTIYNGAGVGKIYDYNRTGWTVAHCAGLKKSLTFDGFVGSVAFAHATDSEHANPNGLDNVRFINGAKVTVTGHKIPVESTGGGQVYFDKASSLTENSLGIVGVTDDGEETMIPLTDLSFGKEILRVFNGSAWTSAFSFSYDTGYDDISVNASLVSQGSRLTLPNDLRHVIKTDKNGLKVGFYGWNVGGEFHFAGETIVVDGTADKAVAVWAPVICIGAADSADEAYAALEEIFAQYPDYPAGILCFDENYTWDITKNVSTAVEYTVGAHEPLFKARSKPVLFIGASNDVTLTLNDTLSATFYYGFASFVGFDGLTLTRSGRASTAGRLTPRDGIYLGPDFSYVTSLTKQTVGLDIQYAADSSEYFVFGGTLAFVYGGRSVEGIVNRFYIGGGANVSIVALNNTNSYSDDLFQIDGGTVGTLYFASLDALNDSAKAGKINRGKMTVTVYGGTINNIYDHNGVNTNNGADASNDALFRTQKFCWDLERTLIFDGYLGSMGYEHLTTFLPDAKGSVNPKEFYPNGLDNLILRNGSAVTFTKPVYMKPHDTATVYVSADSTLTGTVKGMATVPTANDANAATLSVTSGQFTVWNGAASDAFTLDGAIKVLGASIRTEAPYGIRFGYELNEDIFEYATGSEIVKKGVLVIRDSLLGDAALERETQNVLDVEIKKPISADQPDCYVMALVDDVENSDQGWMTAWKDVDFTSRSYVILANGDVVYSGTITRSVQQIIDALGGQA